MNIDPILHTLRPAFDESQGVFSLHTDKQTGWHGLRFAMERGDRTCTLHNWELAEGNPLLAVGEIADGIFVSLQFEPLGGGWAVQPRLMNRSGEPFAFSGYGFETAAEAAGLCLEQRSPSTPVYGHAENLRFEQLPHCQVEYPLLRPVSNPPRRLETAAVGAIPLLLIGRTGHNSWLLEGALTQNRHLLGWEIGLPSQPQRPADHRSRFFWTGGHPEVLKPDDERDLEVMLFAVLEGTPDEAYRWYGQLIAARHTLPVTQTELHQQPVYCTWNYGIYTDIDEAKCLQRLDVVAQIQDGGGWFQIDHGYQLVDRQTGVACIEVDAFYPDASGAWDFGRFPSGPRALADAIRERGLRPSLWFSPRVGIDGIVARRHPDWLLRNVSGEALSDTGHYLLDYSVAGAREFIERCVATITRDWGFEGLKLDFYSWMFDHPRARYSVSSTGQQLRVEMGRMMRRYLGPDGYFLHCISAPLGNPLLAQAGFDAYRAGIDIGDGDWAHHVNGSAWLLPGVLASGRGTWLANIDSCLGAPEIPATERRSRLAFAYITNGMLEFSGPAERFDEPMLRDYRRLVDRLDQGQGEVLCLDQAAFFGPALPRILLRRHDPQSRSAQSGIAVTAAFLNWTDAPQTIIFDFGAMGKSEKRTTWRDFWSGEEYSLSSAKPLVLPPRSSLLLDGF